jgi:hypothetical protein
LNNSSESQTIVTRLSKDRYDGLAGHHHVKVMLRIYVSRDLACEAAASTPPKRGWSKSPSTSHQINNQDDDSNHQ